MKKIVGALDEYFNRAINLTDEFFLLEFFLLELLTKTLNRRTFHQFVNFCMYGLFTVFKSLKNKTQTVPRCPYQDAKQLLLLNCILETFAEECLEKCKHAV